jgi:hypothetical protein
MMSASKCLSNANTEDILNEFYSEDSNSEPDNKEIKEQLQRVLSSEIQFHVVHWSLLPVSCLFYAYSLTMEMEVTSSSETLADLQQTTRCYFPEDKILHKYRESLKSYRVVISFGANVI